MRAFIWKKNARKHTAVAKNHNKFVCECERVLFSLFAVCFVSFVLRSTLRFILKIWKWVEGKVKTSNNNNNKKVRKPQNIPNKTRKTIFNQANEFFISFIHINNNMYRAKRAFSSFCICLGPKRRQNGMSWKIYV